MATNGFYPQNYAQNAGGAIMPPPGKFKPTGGLPEIIALVATTGEMVSSQFGGSEVLLKLTDGRPWYVAPAMADVIRTSGIQPRQQLEVTRTGKGPMDWRIVPLQAHLGGAPAAAPPQTAAAEAPRAVATSPRTTQQTENTPSVNAATVRFVAAYKSAVDVLLEAKTYAHSRGLALDIHCEDVRALAATLIISADKGGR